LAQSLTPINWGFMSNKKPMEKITCDQCNLLSINGIVTHEIGCPNSKKKWIDGQWVKYVKCFECGDEIEEGTECGCQDRKTYSDTQDRDTYSTEEEE